MAKILIVDDDAFSRNLLEFMLQNAGHTVASTANGAEALIQARANMTDLIITDVMMPVMDGFELCRQCKADKKLRSIPIILYSSDYVEQQDQKLGLELGACRYLLKPSQPEKIISIVD